MSTYQTTYNERPAKGVHGQVANAELSNRISRTIETAAVPFGAPVQRGAADHGAVAFTTGDFLGLAILNPAVPGNVATATTPDVYPVGFTAAIMTRGHMYVSAGGTVADGDAVHYNPTTKRFVAAESVGNTVGPLTGVLFDTSGGNGDIVEISVGNRTA